MGSPWQEVVLGDLIRVKHGWPFVGDLCVDASTGCPIVVNIGNFRYTDGFRFDQTTMREYRGEYPAEFELRAGEILLVMTCQTPGGEILGIPARVPDDGRVYLHNQRIGKVVVTRPDRVRADYLYWLFHWREFNEELVASSTGTKILHSAPSRIEAFRFLLPSLDEQDAIADVVNALDEKIELNRQMSRTVEAMAQATFKSWFVDFDPVVAKAAGRQPIGMERDTAKLFPDTFANSQAGPLPSGWRLRSLADVVEINALQISGASAPATIHYIDISSVSAGRIDAVTTHSWASAPSRARRLVRHGDTIWSCVRPNRRSYCLVQHPESDLVVSTGFAVLSPSDGASAFVYLWTTTDDFVEYLASHAEGSAYPAVRPESFARASVPIPPLPVLEAFQERVGPLLNLVARSDEEARTLIAVRDTLIPKLLSGEIRVQEAEKAAGRRGA